MRYTIVLIIAMVFLVGTPVDAQKKGKDKDVFSMKVDGLGCAFCVNGLEKKFKDFKGMKNLKVDLETGLVSFSYPSTELLSVDAVETKIEKAGYTPVWVEVKRADGKVEKNKETSTNQQVAQLVSKKIKVKGNCGMCQSRIEKAVLSLEGVSSASWDALTQQLELEFDGDKIDLSAIEKAIAAVGHDTESVKASDEVYDALHGCCKYDRD